VEAAFAALPEVDVLVNNAGVAESAPLHLTTLASWGRHLDVTGPFLCMRAVIPGMRERGGGSIITIASTAGRVGAPYTSAYTASKHAARRADPCGGGGAGAHRVRVNAVCPTFVRTELSARAIANIVQRTGRSEAEAERALAKSARTGCSIPARWPTPCFSWPRRPPGRSAVRRW
jgi:NAD(P)-dependent dehydrogenase (short-subunit alcohol dehydrogenase family)